MVIIERNKLAGVEDEYYDRLCSFGESRARRAIGRILHGVSKEEFKALVLCPPEQLGRLSPPSGIASRLFVSAYEDFFYSNQGENAMWLIARFGVSVCPYCNRAYTFFVENKPRAASRNIRPELDHFYPKRDRRYMHLALSLYNLVPSCPQCNQLKGKTLFDYHPYWGHINGGSIPRIRVCGKEKDGADAQLFPDNPTIVIENPNINTQTLGLQELYSQHGDYVREILDKIQAYNMSTYKPLVETFQGLGKTEEEIDRLIWGNYIDQASQLKRPLSKMTRDLLEQFDIIK